MYSKTVLLSELHVHHHEQTLCTQQEPVKWPHYMYKHAGVAAYVIQWNVLHNSAHGSLW